MLVINRTVRFIFFVLMTLPVTILVLVMGPVYAAYTSWVWAFDYKRPLFSATRKEVERREFE